MVCYLMAFAVLAGGLRGAVTMETFLVFVFLLFRNLR